VYRFYYIRGDFQFYRFYVLVVLFIMSIIIIIIRPSLFRVLLGWDILGVVSFCLVVYYQNNKRFNSGIVTILRNRLGDSFIILTLCWSFSIINFSFILFKEKLCLISVFLVVGRITKRAQIPFSSWLPAAISAPTPVSSLVHSSTLVTAGVYLILRFYLILNKAVIYFLITVSIITIILRRLSGVTELDLKKL